MATRKRKSLDDITHVFQEFMYYRGQAGTAKKGQEKNAKKLRDFCRTHGTVERDEDDQEITGNIVYKLDQAMYIGDKKYTGFELRNQTQPEFDDEAAIALATRKGILGQVSHWNVTLTEEQYRWLVATTPDVAATRVVDQDAFYVAYQQGKITEEEVDSLLVDPDSPKYALWPVAADDEEEEDDGE